MATGVATYKSNTCKGLLHAIIKEAFTNLLQHGKLEIQPKNLVKKIISYFLFFLAE
jgi:hypothetical protein